MSVLNNRVVHRIVLAAVLLAVVAYAAWLTLFYTNQRKLASLAAGLPPDGLSRYDTHGLVPGKPKNGVQQLQHLYAMYQTYQKLHDGQMPADAMVMINDCWSRRSAYGFADNNAINEYLSRSGSSCHLHRNRQIL